MIKLEVDASVLAERAQEGEHQGNHVTSALARAVLRTRSVACGPRALSPRRVHQQLDRALQHRVLENVRKALRKECAGLAEPRGADAAGSELAAERSIAAERLGRATA